MLRNGDGAGYGYGAGDGAGYGDGFGDGDGVGVWAGEIIGRIGEYDVISLLPWPYIRVGCVVLHVDEWEVRWREIAEDSHVAVSHEDVADLVAIVRLLVAEAST